MKLSPYQRFPRQQGASLIECLVYIAVLGLLMNIALFGFNRCWDDNKHLRHNAEDITRALKAGEIWRADIRAATGTIQVVAAADAEQIVIPHPAGNITYSFARNELHRQAGADAPAALILPFVKSSHMQADPRTQVTAWRWELELVSAPKKAGLLPLFTFESVQPRHPAP
jgi:hypothetical protein